MKLTKKQKVLTGIASLCFILIITNPSATAFKAYKGYSGRRSLNLFIFSVYKTGEMKYVGLFGNFIEMKNKRYEDVAQINTPVDTIVKMKMDTLYNPPYPKGFTPNK